MASAASRVEIPVIIVLPTTLFKLILTTSLKGFFESAFSLILSNTTMILMKELIQKTLYLRKEVYRIL